MSTDGADLDQALAAHDPAALVEDRALLGRTSTADRLAEILRARIMEGFFQPGARLSEEALGAALGVSRNSLREAFRALIHERILVHELNRGVFVRVLTVEDVEDLYRVRKLVECGVVRAITSPPGERLRPLDEAVTAGEEAARLSKWQEVGTADIRFHQALAALAESPRVDGLMSSLLAELRLVFHAMADPKRFHEPYLARNRVMVTTLSAGDGPGTERLLSDYLDDAERQLVEAHKAGLSAAE